MGSETIRPWGSWEVIKQDTFYKIKKLIIKPDMSISEQYHNHRSETWCVVQGTGQVFHNGKSKVVHIGDTFVVKRKEWHRVKNVSDTEDLIAIEIQMGDVCEEDDIVRKE